MNEAPQVQTAEPSTATATPAADTSTSQPDLSNLSLDQINTILSGGDVEVPVLGGEGKTTDQVEAPPVAKVEAPPPGETPAVAETPAAPAEAVEETPVEAPAAPAATPIEPEGIERPRFKNERDQLVVGIYKQAERAGNPISWAEAEARVDGPKAEAPIVVPAVDLGAVVTTLEGEVTALDTKLAEFEEGLFTKEVRELTSQLSEKRAELLLAKRDLQQAAKDAQTKQATDSAASDANRATSHAKALEEFPDAADDTTVLGKDIATYVKAIKNPNHPDHAILFADSAPLTIARNRAAELGIASVKKTVSPPVKSTVEAPPRVVVSPAPGNKTAVAPGQPAEDAAAQLDRALHSPDVSLAELDAVQGMPDPSRLLAGAAR